METLDIEGLRTMLPVLLLVLLTPAVAHLAHAVLARRQPRLALAALAVVTLGWMPWAATLTARAPFGGYSKTAVSIYIGVAALLLWFALHRLIGRAGFARPWLGHAPVILAFGAFAVFFWLYHIAPRLGSAA